MFLSRYISLTGLTYNETVMKKSFSTKRRYISMVNGCIDVWKNILCKNIIYWTVKKLSAGIVFVSFDIPSNTTKPVKSSLFC